MAYIYCGKLVTGTAITKEQQVYNKRNFIPWLRGVVKMVSLHCYSNVRLRR